MASVFGFYSSYRLYSIWRTHLFYILWLVLESGFFFCYFLLKNEFQFLNPIILEIFTIIFYLSSGFFYISITLITANRKSIRHYLLALSPLILIGIIKVVIIALYSDQIFYRVHLYNLNVNSSSESITENPFQIEKVLFLCRHIVTAIYLRLIVTMLKRQSNRHFNESWEVIFKPFRISVYFIGFILLAQLIAHTIFNWEMSDYFFINTIMSFSAIMFFWHFSLLLKDLENPNSIFRLPKAASIANPNIPQESLSILQYIYLEQIYKDNNLSIEKVANKMGIPVFNLTQLFGTTIPFSFSSYINYLRLMAYDKESNSKLDKITNLRNVGFNSTAAFYYWESRKEVISIQINPIMIWINNHDTSKNQAHQKA